MTMPDDTLAIMAALWDALQEGRSALELATKARLSHGEEEFILRKLCRQNLVMTCWARGGIPFMAKRYLLTNEGITLMQGLTRIGSDGQRAELDH